MISEQEIVKLNIHRKLLLDYVYAKLEINDLHGAIDALMDMREIDAKLSILKESK